MAGFPPAAAGGPSFPQSQPFRDTQFDIFEWHPNFRSCMRYFLDHAQHTGAVQAVAAFVNIQLPFQRHYPVISSTQPAGSPSPLAGPSGSSSTTASRDPKYPLGQQRSAQPSAHVTLTPYIRRLVATGFDFPAVLHGFFGDDWAAGIGHLHEAERRNYLFAAKSETWLNVKANYDMADGQSIPFLRPLQDVSEKEIQAAETMWSEWLAMQDWMLGPRAPEVASGQRVRIKTEED